MSSEPSLETSLFYELNPHRTLKGRFESLEEVHQNYAKEISDLRERLQTVNSELTQTNKVTDKCKGKLEK